MLGDDSISWPADVSFEQLIDALVPVGRLSRYVINVGAKDGVLHDPTWGLFSARGYSGVEVEGGAPFRNRLYRNVARVNATGGVHVLWGYAEPDTIGGQLLSMGSPRQPDALKIDIDSTDLPILRAIVASGIRPRVVCIEINSDLPPPVRFTVSTHPQYRPDGYGTGGKGFFGASAETVFQFMRSQKYDLVGFELGGKAGGGAEREHNMWFVASALQRKRGLMGPSWAGMNRAFWKQQWAWQRLSRSSTFGAAPILARNTAGKWPICHTLGGAWFRAGIVGRLSRTDARTVGPRIPCPLQTLRHSLGPNMVEHLNLSAHDWLPWARLGEELAAPSQAAAAQSYAKGVIDSLLSVACTPELAEGHRQEPRICPYET